MSRHIFLRHFEEKYDETLELQLYGLSPDLDLLERRMTQFLGLHYQEPTIESGIDRLDLNQITFSQKGLEKLNQNAITLSQKRQELKDRWQEALPLNEEMEVANEGLTYFSSLCCHLFYY